MYPSPRVPVVTVEGKTMKASERGQASIAEVFVRNAERAPEKLCLRFEGAEIFYSRMRERGRTLREGARARGKGRAKRAEE
jgi:hypothetical protein